MKETAEQKLDRLGIKYYRDTHVPGGALFLLQFAMTRALSNSDIVGVDDARFKERLADDLRIQLENFIEETLT